MTSKTTEKSFDDSTSISCDFCEETFLNLHNYNQHVKLHTENIEEISENCNKVLKNTKAQTNHIVREKLFLCGFDGCVKGFARKHGLERHLLTHSDDFKQVQCPVCQRLFVEKIQLERHYQVHLKEEKITSHQCFKCQKYFNRNADLVRHEKMVHQNKLVQCDQCPCDRRFGSKFAVLRHFKTVHFGVKSKRRKPAKKILLHEILGLSVAEKVDAESFLIENHQNDSEVQESNNEENVVMIEVLEKVETIDIENCKAQKFTIVLCDSLPTENCFKIPAIPPQFLQKTFTSWECQRCNRPFNNVHRLKLHNSRNHNWKCKKCPSGKHLVNSFHRREDFELHWLDNHGDEVFPDKLECSICFDMFADKAALHTHHSKSRARKSDGTFSRATCSYCQEEFKTPTSLKKHLLQVHQNGALKMRKCFNCNLQFQNFTDFKIHVENHENEHFCLICGGKSFQNAKSLKSHKLEEHYRCSEVKPWKCDKCERSFHCKALINRHMSESHSLIGEMFVCESCGKSYHQLQSLRVHRINAHAKNQVKDQRQI